MEIMGVGTSRAIDSNVPANDEESAEVSSSSNISTNGSAANTSSATNTSTTDTSTGTGTGTGSDETNDSSNAAEDANVSQPASKKPRLSDAAANADTNSCDNLADVNDQQVDTVSPELYQQLRQENLSFKKQLKTMADELTLKTAENNSLQNENKYLKARNDALAKIMDGNIVPNTDAEAGVSVKPEALENATQPIDRAAVIELAKKMKICMGCDAEQPSDMLHFCDVDCQKRYL